jgi:hypothetical protein
VTELNKGTASSLLGCCMHAVVERVHASSADRCRRDAEEMRGNQAANRSSVFQVDFEEEEEKGYHAAACL